METIDLTHELKNNMSHSSYDPDVSLIEVRAVEKDGYKDSIITSSMHIGTHIDAPAHMIENGKTIVDYPLDKFIGRGCVFDCSGHQIISLTKAMEKSIKQNDMVVLYTGFDRLFNKNSYYESHPIISSELADFLVKRHVKCLAIDFFSPDKYPFDIHKLLLLNDVLIVENIKGADQLLDKDFVLYVSPLKMRTGGSFSRVFAQIK